MNRPMWDAWCEAPFFPAKLMVCVAAAAVAYGIISTVLLNV